MLEHFFGRLSVEPPDRFDPRSKTGIVAEGVDKFDETWQKVHHASNSNQKETPSERNNVIHAATPLQLQIVQKVP